MRKQGDSFINFEDNGPISRVVAKFLAQKQINLTNTPGGNSKDNLYKLKKQIQLSEENRRTKTRVKPRSGVSLKDKFLYNGAINKTHDYNRGDNMITDPREIGDESAIRIFETADNRPTRTEATPEKKGRKFQSALAAQLERGSVKTRETHTQRKENSSSVLRERPSSSHKSSIWPHESPKKKKGKSLERESTGGGHSCNAGGLIESIKERISNKKSGSKFLLNSSSSGGVRRSGKTDSTTKSLANATTIASPVLTLPAEGKIRTNKENFVPNSTSSRFLGSGMSSSKHHKMKSMGGGLSSNMRESSQEIKAGQKKSGSKEKNYSTTRGDEDSLKNFVHLGANESFSHTSKRLKKNEHGNLSHLTNNFINISLDKNPQKVLSNLFINNEGVHGDIVAIEERLADFVKENMDLLEKEGVITGYIEKFLDLLSFFGDAHRKFEGIMEKIKLCVSGPFSKMMEHFLEVREVIMEQNSKLEEVERLRDHNEHLQYQIGLLLRENEKMESQKSQLSQYIYESKNLDLKEIERIFNENSKLKQSISKQKKQMNETRRKEEKVMRLLYAIRKKGIDIEEIYNENVKTPAEETGLGSNSMVFDGDPEDLNEDFTEMDQPSSVYDEFSKHFEKQNISSNNCNPTSNKSTNTNKINNKLKGILAASTQGGPSRPSGNKGEQDSEFEKMKNEGKINMKKKQEGIDDESKWDSKININPKEEKDGSKNQGGSNMLADVSSNLTTTYQNQLEIEGEKNKFKKEAKPNIFASAEAHDLNGALNAAGKAKLGFKLNLGNIVNKKNEPREPGDNKPILDFQDEFMAKFDEFSQSWRDQAIAQKRF